MPVLRWEAGTGDLSSPGLLL